MDTDETLAHELNGLTRSLLGTSSVAAVLERVVETTLRVIPGASLVSVTLRAPDGTFHTPIETDPVAVELDQIQYDTGEGPCVDTAVPRGPAFVHNDDLATGTPWPKFGAATVAFGYRSVLATALLADARPPRLSGALNIYAREPGSLDQQSRFTALLLATHASLALAGTQAVLTGELRETQLRQALDSRDVIGQAKGILMARRGISADEAFSALREASQDLNIKLAEVAEQLATHHLDLAPPS